MTKAELVAAVATKAEISKKDADAAVKALTEVVTDELKAGGKVQLPGFGTFEVNERPSREGRNPLTGETITIKASKVSRFKASKTLKEALNG